MSKSEKKVFKLRERRTFSEEFKRQKVELIVSKTITVLDVVELYKVTRTSVYRWIHEYSPHHKQGTSQVVQMESEEHKTKLLLQKIADYERMVGRQAIELAYFKELIITAEESLKVDLKKTFGTPPSKDSEPNPKKTSTL